MEIENVYSETKNLLLKEIAQQLRIANRLKCLELKNDMPDLLSIIESIEDEL